MKYFTLFPKINYRIGNNQVVSMTNIFIRPNIKLADIPGINVSGNRYVVEDGESPDAISRQFYQNPHLFWYVLATNNILDVYKEWPVSFNSWKKETTQIYGSHTFFIPFLMDIQVGDIIAKYIPSENQFFDKNNFGVVTEVNPFLRCFDVKFLKGEIREQNTFVVMRKSSSRFIVITTPNSSQFQVLKKRQEKLNSTVSFLMNDKNSKEKTAVSPYFIPEENKSLSSKVSDITGTNCILNRFINNTLNSSVFSLSFSENAQKEWIFNKTIIVIPKQYLDQVNELYLDSLVS